MFKRYLKSEHTDTQTDGHTGRQTFRLIESIGPEGQCFKKWSHNFEYGLKLSSMVQMVLNGLKKIDHKFNRISLIISFNLVLVWSEIVQMLTKKSSQWVRHNQVFWSSSGLLLS